MLVTALLLLALPAPTGIYRVGTTSTIDLVDESRRETAVTDRAVRRQVLIQLWYPAADSRGRTAPYIERLSAYEGLILPQRMSVYRKLWTNAILDSTPIRGKRLPVVLFSHGWQANRREYTIMAEELASQGFFVCGVDHPYMGQIALRNGVVTPSIDSQFETAVAASNYYAADILFAIGALRTMSATPGSRFANVFDLGSIGLIGHSSGYGAVRDAAVADPAIRCIVNVDASEKHPERMQGLAQPILWIRLERAAPPPAGFSTTELSVPNATHGSVMDDPYLFASPESTRDTRLRTLRTILDSIVHFMNASLKGNPMRSRSAEPARP